MTGAIISEYIYKSTDGIAIRHFIVSGSFFFIEPDLAITAYTNLCMERSRKGAVYAEDYLYFGDECSFLTDHIKNGNLINCLWLQREWLKEMPERNITEIHFEKAVTSNYFRRSDEQPNKGDRIIGEGYYSNNFLYPVEQESDSIEFLNLKRSQESDITLFRAPSRIVKMVENECFSVGSFFIEGVPYIHTTIESVPAMIGGPILEFETNRVIGMLSHEADDPYDEGGMKGIFF